MYKFLLFSLGFAIGLFLTSPVYAGTGPDPNTWSEGFYFTTGATTTTSTAINLIYPTLDEAPDYAEYLDHSPGSHVTFFRYAGQPTSSCWSFDTVLVGGFSGGYGSTTVNVGATSGVIYALWSPYESTAPELNTGEAPYGTSVTQIYLPSTNNCKDWTSPYWDIDTLDLGVGGSTEYEPYYAVASATPSFAYPIDGSTTADFPNWVLNLDDLDPYETYYIRILYTITQGTSTYNYYDDSSYVNDTSTSQSLVPIAKNHKLIPVMSASRTETSSVTAVAWIATDPSFSLFVINDSDPITFTVDYYATIPFTPEGQRAINGGVANPYDAELDASIAAGIQECGPAPSWTDFGGGIRWGLCSLIKFTLDPASLKAIDASKEIQISVNKLLHVYPFSIIYTVLENTNNQLESGASASSSDLYFSFNIANQTSSIRVAGPNFMVDTFGLPLTNLLFNGILIIFCLGALWTMYGLVIKLF